MNPKPTDTGSADDALDGILRDFGIKVQEQLTGKGWHGEWWKDSGTKAALQAWKQSAVEEAVVAARIDELERIKPPEQYKEFAKLIGHENCTICGFNSEEFRRQLDIRIAELQTKPKKEPSDG